jgi:serine/threonine protein kinase
MTPERWQRIEQLYHEALERGETQRAAFLQEICAGDDELRQEVASLLAQDNRSQQFLERSELEAAARVVAEKESQTPLIGKRLGSYQVLSQVGAGGMGEVYKARDTRLDRFVAIKVLPPHLADRTELRERFEREARTIASLNHPHICTLHDIGHQVGTDFLVMEYLEGETLAQRLQKGSLPIQQVLQYAIEIADALDKAHRKGVTHRDLKPGNIMLTKLGAKLLDFGLAKLKEELAPANVPLSELPTVDDPLTAKGAIIGTLQYMAPEQLEAKEVDARTDIFAFGAVVYEMATGKKAFEGKSQASLIAKILETDPPPISSLQPMTPPALDRVVRKCLAKEPDQRWQTASDLCGELKWIAEGSSQVGAIAASTVNVQDALRKRFAWASVGLAACAIIALTVWNLKPTPPKPVVRTVITLPPGDRLGAGAPQLPALAISRDGKQLVYAAIHGVTSQLYLRPLDIQEARPIPNTEGASEPFFSPDGQWIGFYAGGKLKKISVSGGAAVILADALNQFGASWGSQSKIVFAPSVGSPLLQVSDAGGDPRPLTQPEKGISDIWPDFLPGGKAVLFTAESLASSRIAALSLATGKQHNLVSGTQPRYSISGHLIYTRSGGTLMAVPFDPQRLEITGTPVPVVEGVAQSADGETTQYSISDSGTLVYFSGGSQSNQRKIVWVSRDGADQL